MAEEPKRIKTFRLEIAKKIPKFPNDKRSLQLLQRKPLGELLIDYNNWAMRHVAPRPRKILIGPAVIADPRWSILQASLRIFLDKVARGDDLTPYLSLSAHKKGFSPAASERGPEIDRWTDKDFVLNVMGYHHFHIDTTIEQRGFAKRSGALLFAYVTREEFTLAALSNHSVFENEFGFELNEERERLWQIFNERTMRGASPGTAVVQTLMASSGHKLESTYRAMHYAQLVTNIDPKIDDPVYMEGVTAGLPFPPTPGKSKWKWHLQYLDLGLLEKTTRSFLVYRKGPI